MHCQLFAASWHWPWTQSCSWHGPGPALQNSACHGHGWGFQNAHPALTAKDKETRRHLNIWNLGFFMKIISMPESVMFTNDPKHYQFYIFFSFFSFGESNPYFQLAENGQIQKCSFLCPGTGLWKGTVSILNALMMWEEYRFQCRLFLCRAFKNDVLMIILFSVFLLMKSCKSWRDFSASFTISTITYENVKKTGKVMVNGMQLPAFLPFWVFHPSAFFIFLSHLPSSLGLGWAPLRVEMQSVSPCSQTVKAFALGD